MLRKKVLVCFSIAALFCSLMSAPAFAEETATEKLLRRIEQLEKRITELEAENQRLSDGVEVIKELFNDPRLKFIVVEKCANIKYPELKAGEAEARLKAAGEGE